MNFLASSFGFSAYPIPETCLTCGSQNIQKVSGITGKSHLLLLPQPVAPMEPEPLIFRSYRSTSVTRYEAEAKAFEQAVAAWLRSFSIWDRCYWCPRCDCVFDGLIGRSVQSRFASSLWQ